MVFGGVEKERIALNEDTLWSGYPKDWNNPGAKEVLPKVRELIAQENYEEADRLCKEMMGPYTQSYLPFGDLHFVMDHGDVNRQYSRKLDLSTGIVTVTYTHWRRSVYPGNIRFLSRSSHCRASDVEQGRDASVFGPGWIVRIHYASSH